MKDPQLEELWRARQAREIHPIGEFEYKGRYPNRKVVGWWPSEIERCSCCAGLYGPTSWHPYALMVHCRTRGHIKQLLQKQLFAPMLGIWTPAAQIEQQRAAQAAARAELAQFFEVKS